MYAGFSGLQPIDSILWLGYNALITTVQMGFTFVMDQDAPMMHSARVVNRHKLLDDLEAKQTGVPCPPEDPLINIYA